MSAQGHHTAPVLSALGIDQSSWLDPDYHVPHAAQDLAFAEAERLTGDSNVGLHAGQRAHVVHLGVVGYLALTCRSGGVLLDNMVRYQSLIGNAVRSTCTRTPSATYLDFELQRQASRHALDYSLAIELSDAEHDHVLSGDAVPV